MPRIRVLDHLQAYPFWLVDLSSSLFTGSAFTPIFGFQSCTSPEITADVAEVKEGNWFYPHHHIRGATVGSISMARGVKFFDSDFYKWTLKALQGQGIVKRDLMLIHYFAISPVALADQLSDDGAGVLLGALPAAGAGGAMMTKIIRAMPPGALPTFLATQLGGAAAASAQTFGSVNSPAEFAPRFPAKAWKLKKCLPTRWKAASDFDAASGDVSVAELEIAPHSIHELSLAP